MSGMLARFRSRGSAGYSLQHLSSTTSSLPAPRAASRASPISSSVAMPVDMIMVLPFEAAYSIWGVSTISNEAILKASTPRSSRKSTAVSSKGVERKSIPSSSQRLFTGPCHSHGNDASAYRS